MELLAYTLVVVMCIGISVYGYIRFTYGFWAWQPVFHVYDVGYMFQPKGVIQSSLPEANKYTNVTNITTCSIKEWSNYQEKRFVQLIRRHYLRQGDNVFSPTSNEILPYFVGHTMDSFVSFYHQPERLVDVKTGNILSTQTIVGTITSRPSHVWIRNSMEFPAYYVDYLCVDTMHRKKGIAPQLIQTHHYQQRRLNPTVLVSIFKREEELTGIVPACVYFTYGFPVTTWTKPPDLSAEYTCLTINAQNFRVFYDFLREKKNAFDLWVQVSETNILELLRTSNLYVDVILCDHQVLACYIYRKSCVEVERGLEVLSCVASICNCEEAMFVHGFKISFWKTASLHHFGYCAIENIADNHRIVENIQQQTAPSIVSPTAYYFYNFAYPTFSPQHVFVLT